MSYDDFIKNLSIHRTKNNQGNGVRLNLALYLYPEGHGNVFSLEDGGSFTSIDKDMVKIPCNDSLEMIDTLIDVLYAMRKKVKKIKT